MRAFAISLGLVGLFGFAVACNSLQNSAAKDPMKCERDPVCAAKNSKDRDCATQCNDDPACMDRCREMQPDTLGHK